MTAEHHEPGEVSLGTDVDKRHLEAVPTELTLFERDLRMWAGILSMDSSEDVTGAMFTKYGERYPSPDTWKSGNPNRP
jgi:hypothetical protein